MSEEKPKYDVVELMDLMIKKGFTKLKMGSLELECSPSAFPAQSLPKLEDKGPTDEELDLWSANQ